MSKILTFIICICFCSFYKSSKDVYIFRNSGFYKSFRLDIEGKCVYQEKLKNVGNGAYGLFIGKYSVRGGNLKVYLSINGKDTLFDYNIGKCGCDSLMMGYSDNNYFVVLNEKEYPWFND